MTRPIARVPSPPSRTVPYFTWRPLLHMLSPPSHAVTSFTCRPLLHVPSPPSCAVPSFMCHSLLHALSPPSHAIPCSRTVHSFACHPPHWGNVPYGSMYTSRSEFDNNVDNEVLFTDMMAPLQLPAELAHLETSNSRAPSHRQPPVGLGQREFLPECGMHMQGVRWTGQRGSVKICLFQSSYSIGQMSSWHPIS